MPETESHSRVHRSLVSALIGRLLQNLTSASYVCRHQTSPSPLCSPFTHPPSTHPPKHASTKRNDRPRRAKYGSATSPSVKSPSPVAAVASARVQGLASSRVGEATSLLSSGGAEAVGGGGRRRSVGFSDTVELASFEHLLWQEIDKVRSALCRRIRRVRRWCLSRHVRTQSGAGEEEDK